MIGLSIGGIVGVREGILPQYRPVWERPWSFSFAIPYFCWNTSSGIGRVADLYWGCNRLRQLRLPKGPGVERRRRAADGPARPWVDNPPYRWGHRRKGGRAISAARDIHGQFLAGNGVAGQNRLALVNREAGVSETIQNFDRRGINLLQAQQLLQQLMAKEQHELLRIGGGQGLEGAVRLENTIGHNSMTMWVPIGDLIPVFCKLTTMPGTDRG